MRRVASLLCVLVFAQGAIAQCAGWQATPEARRQCCKSGACPLHHRENRAPRTHLTQAAADDCCARSQQHQSSAPWPSFASTMTVAVLQSLPPLVVALVPTVHLDAPWETPSPPTHVQK